jgi:hypothetical protein
MPILRIQHAVPDFESWKRAFDNDPLDRRASGVRGYQVWRSVADPNFVIIDLEFGSVAEAEKMMQRLKELWAGPGGAVMRNPDARVLEPADSRTYDTA